MLDGFQIGTHVELLLVCLVVLLVLQGQFNQPTALCRFGGKITHLHALPVRVLVAQYKERSGRKQLFIHADKAGAAIVAWKEHAFVARECSRHVLDARNQPNQGGERVDFELDFFLLFRIAKPVPVLVPNVIARGGTARRIQQILHPGNLLVEVGKIGLRIQAQVA